MSVPAQVDMPRPSGGSADVVTPGRAWAAGLLIVAASVAAYLPALSAGFIWDDPDYVVNNPNLRDGAGLVRTWTAPTSVPQWYPLVFTTFWLEYQLWGLWASGYHLTNVLLHALGAVLLWRVLLRLGLPGRAAVLGALLWSLHPVQVESVAWITERKNTLSLVFYLLAWLALLRVDWGRPWAAWTGRELGWWALGLGAFLLALLSKTVTASLPAAVLLYVYWKHGKVTGRAAVAMLPLFVVGLVSGLFTAHLERTHVVAEGPEWDFTWYERCLIAGRAVVFYLWTLVWPVNLAFIYPRWEIDAGVWWQWVFPAVVLAGLVGLWLGRRRLGRGPFAAAAFYVGTLLPALGFLNVYPHRYSFVADHFQHLASLAPLGLAGLLLARWPTAASGTLLAVLGVLTLLQTRIYRDPLTLWTDTLQKNPRSWMVHINLGLTHHELMQQARTPTERAFHEQKRFEFMLSARELAPLLPETHWNAGLALERRGRLEEARAAFEAAIAADPTFARAHNSLAQLDLAAGELEKARLGFETAVRLQPAFPLAQFNLGETAYRLGDVETSVRHLAAAVNLQPGEAMWRVQLARALRDSALSGGDPQRLRHAAGHFLTAISQLPASPQRARLRLELAGVLGRLGETAAEAHQRELAVREDPTLRRETIPQGSRGPGG